MNVMQLVPMATKFMADPHQGIADLEKTVLMPGWQQLEKEAGAELTFVLNRSDDFQHVTVGLYTSTITGELQQWKSYTLYELLDVLKNAKFPDDTATEPTVKQIAGKTAAGNYAIATSAGTDSATDTGTISEQPSGEPGNN